MKKKNTNFLAILATSVFLVPVFAYADMEMGNFNSSTQLTTSGTEFTYNLNGKIDGYKVVLSWNQTNATGVVGYKIILTNPDGTQKTLSVGTDKNYLENWDAKPGKNVYQLFAMGANNSELSKSNEFVVNMGPNGGYDFSSPGENKKPQFMGSGSLTSEQKQNLEEIKKSLEEQIKYLRESLTPENIDEIKAKAETLKQDYLKKLDQLQIPEFKKVIEERFNMFYQNNFEKKQQMQKIVSEKKQQINQAKDDFKNNTSSGNVSQAKAEMKNQIQLAKDNFQDKKDSLKAKYKQQYSKLLEAKISAMSELKINSTITKIDAIIQNYISNPKLTDSQKEKIIAQLTALKEVLQEKLDDIQNNIDINSIIE